MAFQDLRLACYAVAHFQETTHRILIIITSTEGLGSDIRRHGRQSLPGNPLRLERLES